jgi:3-dehydroquinate synthase
MSEPTVLHVGGASPYDVVVGRDLLDRLPAVLADVRGGEAPQRVALVHDETLVPLAVRVRATLSAYDVLAVPVPSGEAAKTAAVAAHAWEALGAAGFTRSDAVVTLGGGATTDLGGFVAATWLRGVRVVHLPTSLLAMVDAAVGGKTGINTNAGKNLVGSFHEPAGVLCDLALLDSLPREELTAGLGEVVKCGFIADPVILDLVEANDPDTLTPDSPALRELVERAVAVKIAVVVADLKETGGSGLPDGHPGREVLNYGHTMAHAIERTSDYDVRHGEAVAIGAVYVAELARLAGMLDDATADRHRAAFARVGLPTRWHGASYEDLRAAMAVDKKARGSTLRFVVLSGVGEPRVLADPAEEMLRAAYDVMTSE